MLQSSSKDTWDFPSIRGFGVHVRRVVVIAKKIFDCLQKLFPKIFGPSCMKKRLLTSVAKSIVLYAAPIKARLVMIRRYQGILEPTNRGLVIGVSRGYQTIAKEIVSYGKGNATRKRNKEAIHVN